MDGPAEFRFGMANGDEIVFSRREGLRYALSGFLTFTSVPALAAPPVDPPVIPPVKPPANLVTKYRGLGEVSGDDPLLKLDVGGDAHYDFAGTIRVTRLKGITWQGKRNLFDMRSMPDHNGARVSGGALICPDMTPDLNWDQLYQSQNHPRGALQIHKTITRDMIFENIRAHGLGWDFAQIGGGTFNDDDVKDLTFRRCGITMQRDDAFENDGRSDGLLIDECLVHSFVFVSSRNPDGPNGSKCLTRVRKSLVRTLPCRIKNVPNRCPGFFKLDGRSPRYDIEDTIFAVDQDSYVKGGDNFASLAEDKKLASAKGNVICWLGKGRYTQPNPDTKGFTILEGAEAQSVWANALAEWWRGFHGHRFSLDPQVGS